MKTVDKTSFRVIVCGLAILNFLFSLIFEVKKKYLKFLNRGISKIRKNFEKSSSLNDVFSKKLKNNSIFKNFIVDGIFYS